MWRCGSPDCQCERNQQRYLEGDPAGGDDLVRTLTPMVEAILRRYLRYSPYEREDVRQLTFLNMVKHVRNWRSECPFCIWVKAIAIREALTQLRNDVRRQRPESLPPVELVDANPPPLPPSVWKCVERTYEQLPPEWRRAYDLHVHQGMTIKKIAEIEGPSERTLHNWLAEIRRRLTACLD
jgi:RNA polymerase sigma-70 factor, ECF subfamily